VSASWSNSKGSAVTDLPTFQLSSGGFSFDHSNTVSNISTTQAPEGLQRAPFPIKPAYVSGSTVPPDGCAVASPPTTSASPSASPTPATTPSATPAAAAAPASLAQTGGGPRNASRTRVSAIPPLTLRMLWTLLVAVFLLASVIAARVLRRRVI
jgi:hypothetical protein